MAQFQCSEKMYNFILDIINPNMEIDIEHIRETVYVAEDTDFTVEQSKVVWPWLLGFAKEYRDSNDPLDRYAVASAIRTGASMLPKESIVKELFPLLEVNHNVCTVLETVKMIGRIFEAQPPNELNQYEDIAKRMYQIIEFYINKDNDDVSVHEGAITMLAIYALAGTVSESLYKSVTRVLERQPLWFLKALLHDFRELRERWENNHKNNNQEPHKVLNLLNESIYKIAEEVKRLNND